MSAHEESAGRVGVEPPRIEDMPLGTTFAVHQPRSKPRFRVAAGEHGPVAQHYEGLLYSENFDIANICDVQPPQSA